MEKMEMQDKTISFLKTTEDWDKLCDLISTLRNISHSMELIPITIMQRYNEAQDSYTYTWEYYDN